MMSWIILGVLRPVQLVGERLWSPVKKRVGYMFHYEKDILSLAPEIERLEAMCNDRKRLVDDAELKGEEINSEVRTWMDHTNVALTDARKMNEEVKVRKTCLCGWCPNLKWRYSLGKKAAKEKKKIDKQLLGGEKLLEAVTLQVQRPIEIEALMSSEDFVPYESTKRCIDAVMLALKDDQVTLIGIHGIGGVGKTTLVEHVGAQAHREGLFARVYKVVISQNPVLEVIQDKLKEVLNLEMQETTLEARAGRLRERIKKEQNILIILDDVWKKINLCSVGIPGPNELQGCNSKLLITTRRLNVCRSMESHASIHLESLSKEDSWSLFVKTARKSFQESTHFYEVAKKVVGECGGLPIALKAVARAVGNKEIGEWEAAYERLTMAEPANFEDEGDDAFKCIKLSYDYLENEECKSYFLLCCLFPEDQEIHLEELMRYAIGLFQHAGTVNIARKIATSAANFLVASSLLLDEGDNTVKMHDVIRDAAIRIAREDGDRFMVRAGCRLNKWPLNIREAYSYSAISLICNNIGKLPEEPVCSELQILLVQENEIEEIPETFFQSLKALRVLDFSLTPIKALPISISLLQNLRSLKFDNCWELTDISILKEVKKLEILSLCWLQLETLPIEIGELINLRMLDLTNSRKIRTIPSNVFSRLHDLEELHMEYSFEDWERRIKGGGEETNACFSELSGLSNLNMLKVFVSDEECLPKYVEFKSILVNFHICIGTRPFNNCSSHDYNLRSLTLGTTINSLPDWFKMVTEKTETLEYHNCRGINDILVEYKSGKLHGLKCLTVVGCREIIEVLLNATTCSEPIFQKFRVAPAQVA